MEKESEPRCQKTGDRRPRGVGVETQMGSLGNQGFGFEHGKTAIGERQGGFWGEWRGFDWVRSSVGVQDIPKRGRSGLGSGRTEGIVRMLDHEGL